jgi:zinc transport system substrate-binding protein
VRLIESRIRRIIGYIFVFLIFGSISAPNIAFAESPNVVASIKPIHSLIAGVMKGVGKPYLMVRGAESPHTYSLRPSDAHKLEHADAVFWVGEMVESFLIRPLRSVPKGVEITELLKGVGIQVLSAREGGAWEGHAHEEDGHDKHGHDDHSGKHHEGENEEHAHEEDGHDKHGHDDHSEKHHDGDHVDGHIWLDPNNAVAIVRAAERLLSRIDSENAAVYRKNSQTLIARILKLEKDIALTLAPVKAVPYVVFHDAYQYLESHFGLNSIGSVSVHAGRSPGAKRLYELRHKIVDLGAKCVFSEPQFESKFVRTIIEGTGALTGVLDPLGADIPPGTDAYFELMRRLAGSLKSCLGENS